MLISCRVEGREFCPDVGLFRTRTPERGGGRPAHISTPRTHFSRFRSIWDRLEGKSTRGRLMKPCGIDFLSARFQIEQISISSRQKGWFGIDIIDIDCQPTAHIGL
ncbi:hypothetical protein Pst134EB_008394 [Puccinia striiformis f. sp. tritici]|nr:hypothetical protein Pst134EB_008394 [Puccinia striiformis f. sp. tritici]